MDKFENEILDFYKLNQYQAKNPNLHEEDSHWKAIKILPLVDQIIAEYDQDSYVILDVGGGAGLILSYVADYIRKKHHRKVIKYAIDLSLGMLEIQKKNNPDLLTSLHEDIRKTKIASQSVDIALMIDVLEHIVSPEKALKEISRISHYCILKVPLEDNFDFRLINLFGKGVLRKMLIDEIGHINIYNRRTLSESILQSGQVIVQFKYANVFEYLRRSEHYQGKIHGWEYITNFIGAWAYQISPRLTGRLLPDYALILTRSKGDSHHNNKGT